MTMAGGLAQRRLPHQLLSPGASDGARAAKDLLALTRAHRNIVDDPPTFVADRYEQLEQQAQQIVDDHWDKIDLLAHRLATKDYPCVFRREFLKLMGADKPPKVAQDASGMQLLETRVPEYDSGRIAAVRILKPPPSPLAQGPASKPHPLSPELQPLFDDLANLMGELGVYSSRQRKLAKAD
jgi:hypothetical protein